MSIKTPRRNETEQNRSDVRRRKVNAARNSLKFYELWAQFFIFYDFCERLFIRESSTLSNFIAKTTTTFKDLQKKFQISITLRFLIVPLRRGSFKGHPPPRLLPLCFRFRFLFPFPFPFSFPSALVIETIERCRNSGARI